ncbi:MAG: M50 family metallopeptidase [Conexivisphaerales archaeon]
MHRITFAILGILLFLFLATVHELFHGIVAYKLGIKIKEFGFGYGRTVYSKGKFKVKLVPIIAFVDLDEQEFLNAPSWKRVLTAFAGPFSNLLLAFLIAMLIFYFEGFYSLSLGKDILSYVNGYRVLTLEQAKIYASLSNNSLFTFLSESGKSYSVYVNSNELSLFLSHFSLIKHDFLGSIVHSFEFFVSLIQSTAFYISKTGFFDNLTGIVGVIDIFSQADSLTSLLFLTSAVSFSLFLTNMLPILPFDGGYIALGLIEFLFGFKIPSKFYVVVSSAGLYVLVFLFICITFRDFFNLFVR